RNEYVEIKRENIQLINYANFFSPLVTIEYSEYDFSSIMHYGPMYFSKNGSPTIVPRKKYSNRYYEMGNRSRLSEGDIISVQKRYGK
ncbi:MAG: M12 family metallopeptidase, partial [Bdellovibrionota bacterium]|nr:M12 family metallopeptidase [Bdellovibrionota bacterium]